MTVYTVLLAPPVVHSVVHAGSLSHWMGNSIPVRRTYRTIGFAGQKATSNREGGQRTYFSWVSWCKSRLLLIAPRIRRKRISYIVSYFLLFLLPFVLAASVFSLRYALLRLPPKISREDFDRVYEIDCSHTFISNRMDVSLKRKFRGSF